MASIKIFSLAVKTLAKPIANTIKAQATQHEAFKNICIGLAQVGECVTRTERIAYLPQRMHRAEARMRMGLLNEEAKNIKPLNDTRAVQNGATTLAESFLFFVGAGLVLGESYRSSRNNAKRRDDVAERLETLETELGKLQGALGSDGSLEQSIADLRQQNERLQLVLETVVSNGLKAGWSALGHGEETGHVLPLLQANKDLRAEQAETAETGLQVASAGHSTGDSDVQ